MDRYIDADKTLDMMWNALYQYEDDMEKKHGLNLTERLDVQNGFEVAHRVVVNAPAEDVVPVVHAHWIPQSRLKHILYYLQTGQDLCSCSNCTSCGNKLMRHCPTCMAKMDEEVEECSVPEEECPLKMNLISPDMGRRYDEPWGG